MTKLQKIRDILVALVGIGLGIAMIKFPNDAYMLVIGLIGLGLLASGVGTLFYYFTMAMFMVGGKVTLYKGVILTDFAILTLSLTDVPRGYVLTYLIALHVFSGLVEILRALEARRYGGRSWRLKLGHGLVNIGVCAICMIYLRNANTVVIIYGLGLVYSGIMKFISSLRTSTIIFIR
jgi:uncharacterized membrane protein HdeD (DUF308 family)